MLSRTLIVACLVALCFSCERKPAIPEAPPESATQSAQVGLDEPETPPEPTEEEGGHWVTSEAYAVKFRVPDDWKINRGDASISATSPDDTITVLLVGTEGDGVLSTALESIKKEVQFKDLKLEKDAQTVVNGMPGHTAAGSAVLVQESGDQEIQFLLNAVQADDKGVALMVFAEAEMYEARKEEVEGITKTLQRL